MSEYYKCLCYIIYPLYKYKIMSFENPLKCIKFPNWKKKSRNIVLAIQCMTYNE